MLHFNLINIFAQCSGSYSCNPRRVATLSTADDDDDVSFAGHFCQSGAAAALFHRRHRIVVSAVCLTAFFAVLQLWFHFSLQHATPQLVSVSVSAGCASAELCLNLYPYLHRPFLELFAAVLHCSRCCRRLNFVTP